ncbi:MAG: hypothetical protein JWO43_175 [Candidatus Adlerbacteria bacterium]|nr:hypothetical protein [Candidatus Adlerbacteria bacterium]
MQKVFLVSAALVMSIFAAQRVSAQQSAPPECNSFKESDCVPQVPPKATPAPPVASSATPPSVANAGCVLVSLSVPATLKDKPATYWVTFKDAQDGLVAAMASCTKLEVVALAPGSTKSARAKITQGLDGRAFIDLPADRVKRIKMEVYMKDVPTWTSAKYWTTDILGDRTQAVFQPGDETKAGQVY